MRKKKLNPKALRRKGAKILKNNALQVRSNTFKYRDVKKTETLLYLFLSLE